MAGWMAHQYLERLRIDWSGPPDLAGLVRLHRAHLAQVPFENLSIHLDEPIVLDEVELVAKIVIRRRGGFCYELNGGFAWLLRSLGYSVDFLEAAVCRPEGGSGPHFDHMVLRVDLGEPWLVDVGFGDHHAEPLPLQAGVDRVDPHGVFRLTKPGTDGSPLVLWRDGKPQYRLELQARDLSAFDQMCQFHQTSAESHFTGNTICSLPTAEGRVTMSGRTLIVSKASSRQEHHLDDEEVLRCYRDIFGMELARVPRVQTSQASNHLSLRRW